MNRSEIREALNQLLQENAPYKHVPSTYGVSTAHGVVRWGDSDWCQCDYDTGQMTLFHPVFHGNVMLTNWKGMIYLFHSDPYMSDHIRNLNLYGEFA